MGFLSFFFVQKISHLKFSIFFISAKGLIHASSWGYIRRIGANIFFYIGQNLCLVFSHPMPIFASIIYFTDFLRSRIMEAKKNSTTSNVILQRHYN